jgi:hypothetical protein
MDDPDISLRNLTYRMFVEARGPLTAGDIARWLDRRPAGATLSIGKLSEFADAWWNDRLGAAWRPHSRTDNQTILDRLGLTGEFWRLDRSLLV